jgi:hypothetical protein
MWIGAQQGGAPWLRALGSEETTHVRLTDPTH